MYEYFGRVLRVIDGDTMELDLDLGFRVHVSETVRLARINAPDVVSWGVDGLNDPAAVYILANLPIGAGCVAQISRAEKYGRWLADILFRPGAVDRFDILKNPRVLNDELVDRGLAVLYDGGKK